MLYAVSCINFRSYIIKTMIATSRWEGGEVCGGQKDRIMNTIEYSLNAIITINAYIHTHIGTHAY